MKKDYVIKEIKKALIPVIGEVEDFKQSIPPEEWLSMVEAKKMEEEKTKALLPNWLHNNY
jgi:hypothetical protein